jgi:hypothetical protein
LSADGSAAMAALKITATIPPGLTAPGDYSFIGVVNGVPLNVLINLKSAKGVHVPGGGRRQTDR